MLPWPACRIQTSPGESPPPNSKSKIPQGIRGVKGIPGGNRLYLTGLKKSTSLHSPLSTSELSPRNQRFSERDGLFAEGSNNTGEFSCASTPMAHVTEAADIRSKFLFIINNSR